MRQNTSSVFTDPSGAELVVVQSAVTDTLEYIYVTPQGDIVVLDSEWMKQGAKQQTPFETVAEFLNAMYGGTQG
jgi:hypothetical protein